MRKIPERPNYQLEDNPVYTEEVPALLDTDPASATNTFNPLFLIILNNIKASHQLAEAAKEDYENYKAIALAAQATANQAILLAQQAVGIAEQAAAAVVDLSNVVQQNTSKITTLWDAVYGDITTNPFQITFANLDGITLTSGVWNATLQRLEC